MDCVKFYGETSPFAMMLSATQIVCWNTISCKFVYNYNTKIQQTNYEVCHQNAHRSNTCLQYIHRNQIAFHVYKYYLRIYVCVTLQMRDLEMYIAGAPSATSTTSYFGHSLQSQHVSYAATTIQWRASQLKRDPDWGRSYLILQLQLGALARRSRGFSWSECMNRTLHQFTSFGENCGISIGVLTGGIGLET